jgi:FKBP-type peptidyl-prolyl cis-trans isomerase
LQQAQSLDDDFTVTPSGLKVLDVRPGEGATPQPGDTVVIHWSGYTKGYQVSKALVRQQECCRKLS